MSTKYIIEDTIHRKREPHSLGTSTGTQGIFAILPTFTSQELWELNENVSIIKDKIKDIENNIERIVHILEPHQQQIILEDMTFRAKELISSYMKEHNTASISELMEKLHVDLRLICEVIDKLREEECIDEVE